MEVYTSQWEWMLFCLCVRERERESVQICFKDFFLSLFLNALPYLFPVTQGSFLSCSSNIWSKHRKSLHLKWLWCFVSYLETEVSIWLKGTKTRNAVSNPQGKRKGTNGWVKSWNVSSFMRGNERLKACIYIYWAIVHLTAVHHKSPRL